MAYVNGFVAAVPTANREGFLAHAEEAATYFKEKGATRVVECWGVDVPDGEVTSFPMAVKAKGGETVVFSWIEWPSKEVCEAAMNSMINDPRFDPKRNPMPFDGKRMIYGGFEPILNR